MKKIFFFVAVIAFTSASAQENNFFDIQKHLQKKLAEEKLQKLKDRFIPSNPTNPQNLTINLSKTPPLAKLSHTLPNGNKVYLLPIDNMPCIVPDKDLYADNMLQPSKKFELLNNQQQYFRKVPGAIPNPAYPWKIIPDDSNK